MIMMPYVGMLLLALLAGNQDSYGQSKLAEALKGRTAGKPVDCITQQNIRAAEIYDRTAIVYDMLDGTRYVNRPRSGANSLDNSSVMVTNTHSPRLCSIDVVKLVDPGSRHPRGYVTLGAFVPYKK